MATTKKFAAGTRVQINPSTSTNWPRWCDAVYACPHPVKVGWHTVTVTTSGGTAYQTSVPSRRIRVMPP